MMTLPEALALCTAAADATASDLEWAASGTTPVDSEELLAHNLSMLALRAGAQRFILSR